jgi:uncharacterized protein (TIGR02145 family)
MKYTITNCIFLICILLTSCNQNTPENNSSIDSSNKEGQTIIEEPTNDEVKIGVQIWMTKNLDVATFRNGDPIPEAKTDEEWVRAGKNRKPAMCYYNNDEPNKKYGRLYNRYAVTDKRGLAPKGWHIPTDGEFETLTQSVGGYEVAGKKLKTTYGWEDNRNGDNSFGFFGYPSGFRYPEGTFRHMHQYVRFWTADETADETNGRYLHLSLESFPSHPHDAAEGLSVRCIKD